MRLCLPLGVLCAVLLAAPAHAAVRKAPAGSRFYSPPAKLAKGGHGGLIWARRLSGRERLRDASRNELVLYRSAGIRHRSVAVSGTVSLPRGKAPKGGWPVISWAHGTTGIADSCAPSRSDALHGYDHALLQRWLKAGYAVVRTDYEGLGTRGVHPYLIGSSEAHSVLDMIRAARRLDRHIGRQVILAGHSQGGHAALWAAALARRYTPELKVRGTVAFAPASHIGDEFGFARNLTSPGGGITGLGSLIIRGADVARPSLHVKRLLTDQALALYPQTLEDCLPKLGRSSSWGGIAPASIFRPEVDLNPLIAFLNANDPEDLTIHTPVLVEQGKADTTVIPAFTDLLAQEYAQHGVPLTYRTYDGVDHGGIVTAAAADATSWLRARLP